MSDQSGVVGNCWLNIGLWEKQRKGREPAEGWPRVVKETLVASPVLVG